MCFVRPFTLSLKMSQLLLEEMILFLIHDFGIMTCTVSPLSRFTAHLLPVYQKQELPVAAMFVNGSGQNKHSL
jgi:hypothetical protein